MFRDRLPWCSLALSHSRFQVAKRRRGGESSALGSAKIAGADRVAGSVGSDGCAAGGLGLFAAGGRAGLSNSLSQPNSAMGAAM